MKNLLYKEFCLSTSPISYIFIVFSLMVLIPGYPILMGAFFICMGIFQSYQLIRDQNDILYSALLPVRKRDVVTAKYISDAIIQAVGFLIMCALTVLRMTVLSGSPAYTGNVMMPADPVFLAFVLIIFAEFNVIFLGGFFKTAYYFGKPFILFIIASMITVGVGEALHHMPRFPAGSLPFQLSVLAFGLVIYTVSSLLSLKASQNRFEKIDL